VDGPAAAAGSTGRERRSSTSSRRRRSRAIARGFSSNLVVHAFARTARECGIGERSSPVLRSMRTTCSTARARPASHDDYVYGSAEVVGLMCLQVFVNAGARIRQARRDLVDGPGDSARVPGRQLPARPAP
jgi:phytoene/squalene synthetase